MKQIDWPVMIQEMLEHVSIEHISRKTGVSKGYLSRVSRESASSDSWDTAIAILQTYVSICGRDALPILGEYNVYIKEDEVA